MFSLAKKHKTLTPATVECGTFLRKSRDDQKWRNHSALYVVCVSCHATPYDISIYVDQVEIYMHWNTLDT